MVINVLAQHRAAAKTLAKVTSSNRQQSHLVPLVVEINDFLMIYHRLKRTSHKNPKAVENYQDISHEKRFDLVVRSVWRILGEIKKRIDVLSDRSSFEYVEEWTIMAWGLISVMQRFYIDRHFDISNTGEIKQIMTNAHETLDLLLQKNHGDKYVPQFISNLHEKAYQSFTDVITLLENMSSMETLEQYHHTPGKFQHDEMILQSQVNIFINLHNEFSRTYGKLLWDDMRSKQVRKMTDYGYDYGDLTSAATTFHTWMMYMLGSIAAKIEANRYASPSLYYHAQAILSNIFYTVDILLSDAIICLEPSQNPILVTNNLFPIKIVSFSKIATYKSFSLQIVSEETAVLVQEEMIRRKLSNQCSSISVTPSAALLAMKPATGVKRNNATANDGGGNTAHKKSDVNSKEWISIEPFLETDSCTWIAQYPHLLCTTRQKDAILDSRSNSQTGKRPLFYIHVCAEMISIAGHSFTAHTLSMPFSIATRRNQDCQVQRMMSSYTATCFWIYGTNNLDGLLLAWSESGVSWHEFKHLYARYFSMNAEVKRTLSSSDLEILKYKLVCDDCKDPKANEDGDIKCTFKSVLCPHLHYSTKLSDMRFCVWRGMLELLHLFSDQKTEVKHFWEKGVLMGFLDITAVNARLQNAENNSMIVYLSFVIGGCVCLSIKANGRVIHLEPLDLKRLQSKGLGDFIRDIVIAEKIDMCCTVENDLLKWTRVSELPLTRDNMREEAEFIEIKSNVSHNHTLIKEDVIHFTPMRIAVVTCRKQMIREQHSPPYLNMSDAPKTTSSEITQFPSSDNSPSIISQTHSISTATPTSSSTTSSPFVNGNHYTTNGHDPPSRAPPSNDFVQRLTGLMQEYGKSSIDVLSVLGFSVDRYNTFCLNSMETTNSMPIVPTPVSSEPYVYTEAYQDINNVHQRNRPTAYYNPMNTY